MITIDTSELRQKANLLRAGDEIALSGTVYTARDAAHKRMIDSLDKIAALPFSVTDAVIYYAGPTPARDNMPVGSCGPTTSSRMDIYAPRLYDLGLMATIGKGARSDAVTDAIVRNHALYLCAIGGAGALAAKCITSCEVVAYDDLGCESVKRLHFSDFPLFVGIDSSGGSIFAKY